MLVLTGYMTYTCMLLDVVNGVRIYIRTLVHTQVRVPVERTFNWLR